MNKQHKYALKHFERELKSKKGYFGISDNDYVYAANLYGYVVNFDSIKKIAFYYQNEQIPLSFFQRLRLCLICMWYFTIE